MKGFAPVELGYGVDTSPKARSAMSLGALLKRIALAAGPYPTRWSTNPADDLTPEGIVGAMREAHAGYPMRWAEMIEQMLGRNPHLKTVFRHRRAWITNGHFRCDPPEQYKKDDIARLISSWLTAIVSQLRACWAQAIFELLSASAYGYSCAEVFWAYKSISFTAPNGRTITTPAVLVPVLIKAVHQKHWRFSINTDQPLLWAGQGKPGIPWPWGKFIYHQAMDDGIIGRRGFMTAGSWMDLAIQNGWAALIVFMKQYGLPQLGVFIDRVIETGGEEREKIDQMIQDYGESMIGVFDNEIDLRQVATVQGDIIHQDVIRLGEMELSKLVLGTTLLVDQGTGQGSYNMSDTHAVQTWNFLQLDNLGLSADLGLHVLDPCVEFNIDALWLAFTAAGYRTDPSQIRERMSVGGWRAMEREPSTEQRLAVFEGAERLLAPQGIHVDPEQICRELAISVVRSAPAQAPMGPPSADTAPGLPPAPSLPHQMAA